jgi:hypothetical protein
VQDVLDAQPDPERGVTLANGTSWRVICSAASYAKVTA